MIHMVLTKDKEWIAASTEKLALGEKSLGANFFVAKKSECSL